MLSEIVELINTKVPSAKAQEIKAESENLDSSILVEASSILEVAEFLKNNEKYPFNALQVISGVDHVDFLEVNYMLTNFSENYSEVRDLIIKVRLEDRVDPRVPTLAGVWRSANWQERECYDMIGVSFENHPDHRRILCPDDWEGFPLRKDYITAKYYHGMETFPDSKMNLEIREFVVRQKEIKSEQEKRAEE